MTLVRWSTWAHKWLALIVGLQVLFWVGGGLVMTVLPIERVRGEHRLAEVPPVALDASAALPLPQVLAVSGAGPVVAAELKSGPRGLVWVVTPAEGDPITLSATTGRALLALDAAGAEQWARMAYKGPGQVVSSQYLPEAPQETGREGPLWRVDFNDPEKTRFYVSLTSGEVVTRRSGMWSLFDLMWRLHVMDWNDGEDFNHPLIIVTAALSLVITVSGFVLLWSRFVPRRRRRAGPDSPAD